MPTYEFECADCGSRFEKFMCFADKDKAACVSCGSGNLQQSYSSHIFVKRKPSCQSSSCASCSQKCPG